MFLGQILGDLFITIIRKLYLTVEIYWKSSFAGNHRDVKLQLNFDTKTGARLLIIEKQPPEVFYEKRWS